MVEQSRIIDVGPVPVPEGLKQKCLAARGHEKAAQGRIAAEG